MKKVLYTMAMFSMVAMFAACGGSDNKAKEGENGKDGNGGAAATPAAAAEKVAKKVCDCYKSAKSQEEAMNCDAEAKKMQEELTAAFKDDEAKMKEFDDAGRKYMEEKCK